MKFLKNLVSETAGLGAAELFNYIVSEELAHWRGMYGMSKYRKAIIGLGKFGIMLAIDRQVSDAVYDRITEIEEDIRVFLKAMTKGEEQKLEVMKDDIQKYIDDHKEV